MNFNDLLLECKYLSCLIFLGPALPFYDFNSVSGFPHVFLEVHTITFMGAFY